MQVNTANYRFARVTWNDTNLVKYGSAGDCISRICNATKIGKFKMNIRESGLQFVTPIKWRYLGWPPECARQQPLNYTVDEKKQVVSGNCGSRCGGCEAEEMFLKIEGC